MRVGEVKGGSGRSEEEVKGESGRKGRVGVGGSEGWEWEE